MHHPRINASRAIVTALWSASILAVPVCSMLRASDDADPKHTNRLAQETSPYLLLHAHNPVDWYPWGPAALTKAREENKLIFLSIGYSSCYWCHVMERESFSDPQIASFLNDHFVCIKVDREERPDIDEIYMTSLQVYFQLIGSKQTGGWPLSMFLTPQAKPILGGTYFPPHDRDGISGFTTVLQAVHQLWLEQPDRLLANGERLSQFVQESFNNRSRTVERVALEPEILTAVIDGLAENFDAKFGGFGFNEANPRRPKFPEASNLRFLLAIAASSDSEVSPERADRAREMLISTLDHMAAGGIRDHLGGGFHRYSTDRFWHIPHFEKMLYDNGQLASIYAEAFALTGDSDYRRIVDELLAFVSAELTDPAGAFYSALDAETDAEEGAYYRWTLDELREALTDDEFELFTTAYDIDDEPNFEDHHVPLLEIPLAEIAKDRNLTLDELHARLEPIKKKLLAVRATRERPLCDTKILTAWNGLMIRGFADAGRILENPAYVDAAARAADFLLENVRTDEGRLLRTHSSGEAKLNAYLDDYAFFVDGLLALDRATDDARWLEAARQLTDKQIELFWDDEGGGFFYTSDDHEELIARSKDPVDSATPSGNAVAADNLLRLADRLDDDDYRDRAERTLQAVGGLLLEVPSAMPRMALALHRHLHTAAESTAE